MASPAHLGAPRPGQTPPNFNPNYQRAPDALADNMQNLQLGRPTGPPPPSVMGGSSVPRHPPFASPPYGSSAPQPPSAPTSVLPPSSLTGASPMSRPGPPPAGFPRGPPPALLGQNLPSGRPSGPPLSQPPNIGPRPSSGPFGSAPMTSQGPYAAPPSTGPSPSPFGSASMVSGAYSSAPPSGPLAGPFGSGPVASAPYGSAPSSGTSPGPFASGPTASGPSTVQGPLSNGPPARGNFPGAPAFPVSNNQYAQVGPPPPGSMPRGPPGQTTRPFPGSPPSGAPPLGHPSQPPPPFSAGPQAMPPPPVSPYSSSMGQMPPMQGPPIPGNMPQPPRMYGMPQPGLTPGLGHLPLSGAAAAVPSKIDPNQIPRPFPTSSTNLFETRQNGQANIPPPATSEYITRDMGNCSPRYMRCTVNQIPCTGDLLSTSSMQLALMVQPLALPHPNEEAIQVVDFGESGPVRCSRCKGYINPFMKFIDQGRRFICNLCGFTDETPREYHCNLGPDGRRRDADERPELCRGTVEFVATKEYMVRDPMPAVFFFLVDVSMNAIQTGATAAACSAINQAITDLPEGPRTMVGIATFDSTIHFYNLKRVLQQPLMLIVPDVQDVYTPLQSDVIVQLAECRHHLEQLLENIPTMFQSNKVAESAFGAAMQAAFLAMKNTGGKLLVFQSVLPSIGFGALSARETEGRSNVTAGEKEVHKLLQPADKTLKTMAIEFAEFQVCVDMFITSQTYVDMASISVVPRTTGGQVYYYYPFSALPDSAKLYNDLRWNVTRPQGFEAVLRVRCSQGLQVQEYSGSFCKRIPTDVDLPAIDCDKTIMVTFKHDDKFLEGSECGFQCALLYTTVYGERRIRVTTLSLPCTAVLSNLFRSADLDSQFACLLKQAANEVPTKPLAQVREHVINMCIEILHSYRKFCATVSSSGQLILPEALKLLPLYTLALVKSTGLRTDGRLDDRSYWVSRVTSVPTPLTVPLVYPRMVAVHDLLSKEEEEHGIPPPVPLSSEHVTDDGIYFLETGEDGLLFVGKDVSPDVIQQLFDVSSIDDVPTQFVLQQYNNALSKKLNDVINAIRSQRCSYLRLRLCKKGDPSGMLFYSYMVEDKGPGSPSYVEFLVHVHRQIQTKMA